MKVCSVCKIEKESSEFNRCARHKDGLRGDCRSCQAKYRKIHFQLNREKQLAQSFSWKENNRERVNQYAKDWSAANPERRNANEMKRHARKVSSSLLDGDEWNDFVLQEIYEHRRVRSDETGTIWHVDHVTPLQGKQVCGLHVWYNLQLLPASENCSKNNSF